MAESAVGMTRMEIVDYDSLYIACLLYTSDAADDLLCVDLGGRRIIKKKNKKVNTASHICLVNKTTKTTNQSTVL